MLAKAPCERDIFGIKLSGRTFQPFFNPKNYLIITESLMIAQPLHQINLLEELHLL